MYLTNLRQQMLLGNVHARDHSSSEQDSQDDAKPQDKNHKRM